MKDKKRIKLAGKMLKWAVTFFIVFLTAFYISRYWFQLILIQGDSMKPAYRHLQLVLLDKHDKKYTYGDVVAFSCSRLDAVLLKRVAAVPGDTVQIIKGTLYINGRKSTVYPQVGGFSYAGIAERKVQLGEEEYFVIGDCVEKSKDSRNWEVGIVSVKTVIGKVE